MITIDDAYNLVNKLIQRRKIDVFIISIRSFSHGWIFEYQDKEYLNNCDYLSILLDAPYILVDKNTQEIFFVYLKTNELEIFLDNYHYRSDYIANQTLVPIFND